MSPPGRPRSEPSAAAAQARAPRRAEPGRLSSVAAAARLLKAFSAEEPELGITALAGRLKLAKSTVHRLASTLVAEGLLEQDARDGRYRLGLQVFSLGTLVRRRMDVSREAMPHLHALRDACDETVHLAVLDGSEILYLYNLESHQAIRMRSYLGVRKPAFCTSEGRVLLALGPAEVAQRALAAPLQPRTVKTVTDPAALARTLDAVRRTGVALDEEESELGMCGIAAPVFDAGGTAVAAVGVAGPVQRIGKRDQRRFTQLVSAAARAISARLGYREAA